MNDEAIPPATPDVSVIVPVHNVAPWVADCLASILSDQDVDHEVIVIDDASTDDTWEVVSAVARRDPRVRLLRNPGVGGADARNHGVRLARGDYIAFADGDDLVPRRSYESMLTAAREDDADMVVGGFLKFYTTRTWHPTANWPAWAERRRATTLTEQPSLIRNRACWNRLFRRDFWTREDIRFPTVPRSNDVVPMTQALVAARSISVLPETVYLYRNRPGATSMSARAAGIAGFGSYLRQELGSSDLLAAVGDERLDREYERLVLVRDGWVHLQNFLTGLGTVEESDDQCAAQLDELTDLVDQLIARFPADAVGRLDALARWTWSLARAGRWTEAARLATEPEAVLISDTIPSFPSVTDGSDAPADATDYRRALTTVLLRLTSAEDTDESTAENLAAHADLLRRTYPDSIRHWQPAAVQELVLAALTGDPATVFAVLSGPSLAVTDARLSVTNGRAALSATVRSAEPITTIAAGAAQGSVWRPFGEIDLDPRSGLVTAVAPVSSLPAGRAFIRLRLGHPLGTIDVVVPVAVARDPDSARAFRSGTNRQVHINPGLMQQVRTVPRRAARAARRTVRRMLWS
ncbi:glycosyltransferase [Myceligenerans pegani]|uniref:Glycosyltransferase family 2 protein n=1 Tax=Myceligenerans pegani TaxID=2776917 RepID=A0ABR9MYD6_9MICO|nr:glycosyltransferase family 2 protein [Myceligenerans sp. TRM 65318]MBE1876377.1 glycosyltransferase family 2 protein [Myceligenerans sp. TRM 65318]MBE3018648.1 glycosyltransferase family 2 protein [Myceligenerans sp. TRM 65318]